MTLIIFEGLPGTGKTTLIHQLSKELNLPKIEEILDQNLNKISPQKTRGFSQKFFFHSDKLKYSLAKETDKKKIVLMDRGIFSTWAYNICLNDKNILRQAKNNAKSIIKKYDSDCIYMYIKISAKLSLIRKKKKENDPLDIWSFKENLKKTEKFYDNKFKSMKNVIVIDGSKNYDTIHKELKILLFEKLA